jgi:hypothetical protein
MFLAKCYYESARGTELEETLDGKSMHSYSTYNDSETEQSEVTTP